VLGNALIRRPSFIAIDEPETHLHPTLQLDFLTTLASYARNGVLFATHSMGLARSTADRLYSVQQSPQGSIVREYHRTPHFAEFLGSMGIAGLQELGWDKILLVEGPTEVRTFQQFLRRYGKDRSVVLLSLGGSSLINGKCGEHLSEVVRLGGKVAAVIDSERSAVDQELEKPRREFAEICAQLGIECHVLQRRATENYLSDRALKTAFGPSVSEPGHYDKPEPNWGKTQNWLAARESSLDELNATDLGPFLAQL
jgi:energy-coupling factor transporter ATP-binding protein EcfA2